MVRLRKPRGFLQDMDSKILTECFYSKDSCETVAKNYYKECIKEKKFKQEDCAYAEWKALVRYCTKPMKKEEAFCKTLITTPTTPRTTTILTTTTKRTTTTTKNPLIQTQYVVSYGAIGAVFVILLLAMLICYWCNRRSEKKKRELEQWNIPGWSGTSTASEGSKKSDVEKGVSEAEGKKKTTVLKTAKSKTGTTKSTGTSATSGSSGTKT